MAPPFVLAQLTDLHVGADWVDADPAARVTAAVETIRALPFSPGALLVSGDLAEHGADAEYELVQELLAPLGMPLHVMPGNHDDRATLRRHFGLPGAGAEPIHYAAGLGPLRLVVLDTTVPGEDPGALDAGQLGWLDAELSRAPEVPTLLAMHHPPFATGIPPCDAVGLAPDARRALGDVVARHSHVRRIVAGHVHRTITGELAGRTVLTVPSTYAHTALDLEAEAAELVMEPPAVALHAVVDGVLVSHLQPVDG